MSEIQGEHYEGLASKFDDSRFINFSTLYGVKDATVTVKEVVSLSKDFKFENGQRLGKDTLTLKFEETPKCLRLNATNRKGMVKLYGNKTKEWVGKQITLWADPSVKFAGKAVGGIKIREESI